MSEPKGLSDLDAVLGRGGGASAGGATVAELEAKIQAGHGPGVDGSKSKQRLNGENQTLTAANERLSRFVRVLAGMVAVLVLVVGGLLLFVRGTSNRKFREAFEVLAYREARTLQANAIVLAEYCKSLNAVRDEVAKLPSITEEERQTRLRALTSTIDQAENLKNGFLKLIADNEKERGKGASFQYIDPFLKRPIKFEEELGGEINLDKLRDDVKATAKMDDAMKELRAAFLDPIPLAEQMRAEAKRQNAPKIGPEGVMKPDADQLATPSATPLQKLPGM